MNHVVTLTLIAVAALFAIEIAFARAVYDVGRAHGYEECYSAGHHPARYFTLLEEGAK